MPQIPDVAADESTFTWIYGFTAHWERGIHRPTLADPNPTKDGVTQRLWDALSKQYGWAQKSVYDLTYDETLGVFRLIWVQSKARLMPRLVAAVHFDCSVNMSGPRANRVLQRAAGVYADGVVGEKTLDALWKNSMEIARRQIGWREAEYHDLVEHGPRLKPNLAGWLNRTADLRRYTNL